MPILPMRDLLIPALTDGYAVPSFCVWNAETLRTVLEVAADLRAPVIVMAGPMEYFALKPHELADITRWLMGRFDVPIALHLDHGDTIDLVEDCLDAGYSSVMLDYSSRPFDENVTALRRVVELARPHGVTVEGEIGHVGRADTIFGEGVGDPSLTDPAEAAAFAAETGVDALAVSFGNAHGSYTRLPRLDFERLAAIRAATDLPLVLHGGSGTPEADLKRAIQLGIAKVNVATDLVTAYRETLRSQWDAGRNLWAPVAMGDALRAMAEPVAAWIQRTGAAGKAY
ncbi:MAG: class II fructose-bisphosphate aldolase [Anaerolineae bacterium]